MANPWFKFYGMDYLMSPTISRLTGSERSCWVTLMALASTRDNKIEFLDESTLLMKSGIMPGSKEWEETSGIIQKFINFKLITIDNDVITLPNFKKRQEISLTSYERVKRYRDKRRNDNGMIQNDNARIDKIRIDKNKDNMIDFEKFWFQYPKKIGKKKAQAIWLRIKPSGAILEKIYTSLAIACKSTQWKKENGLYIPHATTWLNQERWNDEMEIGKQKIISGKFDNIKSKTI